MGLTMGAAFWAKEPEKLKFKATKRGGKIYLKIEYKVMDLDLDFDGRWVLNLELTPEKARQLVEVVSTKLVERRRDSCL